ncbi:hypothetical protein [Marinomonas sp. PE14-40]|uniref:hypothetical protein n=1 Tax=Marinomonas sp. PE14-40 TaxID=3060621 RepID=UPI003F666299
MLRLIIGFLVLTVSFISFAEGEDSTTGSSTTGELQAGKIYRLSVMVKVKRADGVDDVEYTALKNSKYEVISIRDNEYTVKFNKIYPSNPSSLDEAHLEGLKWVNYDFTYILKRDVSDKFDLKQVSKESLTGLSSGPLVVPFKYRTNSKSLSGDATVGLYAGVNFEPGCTTSNWCFRITPLISAGLSEVSVVNGTSTETKTAVTWAAGFLVSNWDDVNIGVVYGQDRIGGSTWEHEGKGWVSIMIGWDI